jgi:hypothetical protein
MTKNDLPDRPAEIERARAMIAAAFVERDYKALEHALELFGRAHRLHGTEVQIERDARIAERVDIDNGWWIAAVNREQKP